jgi:hypothetical protein
VANLAGDTLDNVITAAEHGVLGSEAAHTRVTYQEQVAWPAAQTPA